MLEDKLKETDWEVTQESIEEQVARESYLQSLRDNETQARRHTATSVCIIGEGEGERVVPTVAERQWDAGSQAHRNIGMYYRGGGGGESCTYDGWETMRRRLAGTPQHRYVL